jgi:hypothetical protein
MPLAGLHLVGLHLLPADMAIRETGKHEHSDANYPPASKTIPGQARNERVISKLFMHRRQPDLSTLNREGTPSASAI